MLRLQQILSGHLKTDDGEIISFPTQRLDALLDICHESSGKIIIWSRFRYDIISITETLKKVFPNYLTYFEAHEVGKRFKLPFTPMTISNTMPDVDI